MPVILIGISITVFFLFSNPLYDSADPLSPGITTLQAQLASLNKVLDNSKALKNQVDTLTAKENSIDSNDLANLQKLLPNNIDNIRLILEIQQIATPYGMVLKDIKYNATDAATSTTSSTTPVVQGGGAAQTASKNYGIWNLEFSAIGTYDNFLNFTSDLEKNLRIVDISSIQFASNTTATSGPSASKVIPGSPSQESYKYDFKIKTYWLKN
jgi:Tfp pilus assembly protein PilO